MTDAAMAERIAYWIHAPEVPGASLVEFGNFLHKLLKINNVFKQLAKVPQLSLGNVAI